MKEKPAGPCLYGALFAKQVGYVRERRWDFSVQM